MKNAVLDPAILFISETDWFNDHKRDEFLRHLINNLTNIDRYSAAKILWNDELENCLWSHPSIPPWRQDRDWGNQLIPTIYPLLQRHKEIITCYSGQTFCNVQPVMNCCNPNALICFLRLMHTLISFTPDILLCLGLANILSPNSSYVFSCNCCSKPLIPELICHPTDWLRYTDLETDYWPNSVEEQDKLDKALEIIRITQFNDAKFLYKVEYSTRFIKDLASTRANRVLIMQQIVKRLISTRQQAMQDASLQDEYLLQTKESRFRVTGSTRIHYNYVDDKSIILLHYYDEGRHDNGL